MMNTVNSQPSFGAQCYQVYRMLCCLNRHHELLRLVRWAERKRLVGPCRLYRSRLADEDRRLLRYALDAPTQMRCARWLHRLNQLINPTPRYLPKGSARVYRVGHV